MSQHDVIRLQHMLDAVEEAMSFVRAKDRTSLDHDRKLVLALRALKTRIDEAPCPLSVWFSRYPTPEGPALK